jgi:hypothetical protein
VPQVRTINLDHLAAAGGAAADDDRGFRNAERLAQEIDQLGVGFVVRCWRSDLYLERAAMQSHELAATSAWLDVKGQREPPRGGAVADPGRITTHESRFTFFES